MSAVQFSRKINSCKNVVVRPRVAHFGTAHIGNDIAYDCAVLEDGRRGYIYKTLRSAIGLRTNIPVPAFERFCAEIAPNALKYINKSESCFEVSVPSGGIGIWVEVGILPDLASDIIQAAVRGNLRKRGQQIKMAFPMTGEIQ